MLTDFPPKSPNNLGDFFHTSRKNINLVVNGFAKYKEVICLICGLLFYAVNRVGLVQNSAVC